MATVNQKTAAPTRKVKYGTAAGALVTVAVWAASYFAHVDVPDAVSAALVVLIMFGVFWRVPSSALDQGS